MTWALQITLRRATRAAAVAIVVVVGFAGCGSGGSGERLALRDDPAPAPATAIDPEAPSGASATDDSTPTGRVQDGAAPTSVPTSAPIELPTVTPVPSPTPFTRPSAPNGRQAPTVASNPVDLAGQIATAEAGLGSVDATVEQLADYGHLHQVAIRKLGYEPEWDVEFFEALPAEYRSRTLLHLSARRALIELSSGYDAADFIPAWEIVEPEPAESLLSHYQAAEAATGIEWEYLAAINLIETGMGRIRGLSSAGAQGPMQFLPTTWAESGIGEGDIEDPHDAIQAAARYLVRRGGPADMPGAIWGYNNHTNYVTAVQAYAELLRQDPVAFNAIHHWEIYFHTEAGDVWLPTGFRNEETIDLVDFLATNPWSAPDPGLS